MRILIVLLLPVVLAVPLAGAQGDPEYASHVVVVQFAPEVAMANRASTTGLRDFDQRASQYGVHLIARVYPFLDHVEPTPKTRQNLMALRRTYYVRYQANVAPKAVASNLATAPGVVYAEPVLVNRTQAYWERVHPNDPMYSQQTELRQLRLPEAWDEVKSEGGAPRVVIAIVDGGGEWRHEDLRANVWTNPGEVADNGVDDDGNGFIDDVHGVNFANGDDTDNDPTGLPETPSNAQHGTAVAGSASAVTDNSVGVAGAAWNADLMHINAGCEQRDSGICYGYEGILYAAANGADIINASWGGLAGHDDYIRLPDQTLNLATDMGALVVAAAGNFARSNDLFRYYPARSPRVLSVGATEKDTRRRAGFSNYGKLVNVFAPGEGIVTTGSDNGYISASGTSFSSPLTAGVAALVKTRFPNMGPDALREHIRLTSDNMDAENPGLAGRLGRGFVNALAALGVPAVPAVRLKRWSWVDDDGDRQIASGDVVTVTATVVNYLADARQLRVGLVGAEPYSFIDLTAASVNIGSLAGGDSVEVRLEFTVASDAPANQRVRFFTHIREGAHEDEADQLSFRVNRSLEPVHQSLSALYVATGGDEWTRNDHWDITTVPNEEALALWFGVFLNQGWLYQLALPNNNLTGSLPPELGNLSELQVLWLSDNSLTGPLPPEIGNLSQLQGLYLYKNSLTGSIPSELGKLSELQELQLFGNSLTGPLPAEIGNLSQLQVLWMDGNSLTGPLPPEIGNLSQLQVLYLYKNSLTGPIPSEIGNLSELRRLSLHSNSLTGPLPPELGNLSQLQVLYLDGNRLAGSIPAEISNLSALKELYLYNNSLTGSIPPEIGNLSALKELFLSRNSLTGSIPAELGNLSALQALDLSSNLLTGPLPPELGNLSELQVLDLRGNSLTGPLPAGIGNLSELQWSYLNNTSLTGPLPPEIGNLSALQTLYLHDNSLTGPIPPEIGNLSELGILYLYNNSLTGPLPPELGNLSQLRWLSLHNNSLTGVLPRSLMQLDSLSHFYFYGQELCAPADNDFQAWLSSIPNTDGPTCAFLHLTGTIANQTFPRAQPIAPLVLPEASGGVSPINYTLAPTPPTGLSFDSATRTISGTPTEVTQGPLPYTYTATDANGSADSLHFTIEVFLPLHLTGTIANQTFPRAQAIAPLVLPEASGGVSPINYTLAHTLPTGLSFDSATRTISGTPTEVTQAPLPYTYTATDAIGSADSLHFTIEVFSPVAAEHETLPESFAVHGNYPNPFRAWTRIVFDLPWPARVTVEVMDLTGRRVLAIAPVDLAAGWAHNIAISGLTLSSGLYLYRLMAVSPESHATYRMGRFVHIR